MKVTPEQTTDASTPTTAVETPSGLSFACSGSDVGKAEQVDTSDNLASHTANRQSSDESGGEGEGHDGRYTGDDGLTSRTRSSPARRATNAMAAAQLEVLLGKEIAPGMGCFGLI